MTKLFTRGLTLGFAMACWAISGSVIHASYITALNTIAGADKISYWNLQETIGNAGDSWGTNDGTFSGLPGAVTQGAAGPRPTDGFLGFSPSNNAVAFSGHETQLLQMNSSGYAGMTDLTLLLWFKVTDSQNANQILGGLYDTSASDRYGFLLNSRSSAVRAGVRVDDGMAESGGLYNTGNVSNRDGDWHFAALTIAPDVDVPGNTRIRIYYDGVDELIPTSIPGEGVLARTTAVLAFGNDIADTVRGLPGSLDEIAFIGRALSDGEIAQLWNAATVPEPTSSVLLGTGCFVCCAAIRKRRASKK